MDNKELLKNYEQQFAENTDLEVIFRLECDFYFKNNINVKEDILICGEESNYEIYPFGKDSMGGVFCLLDEKYVGYISSEGGCGIIARNVKEFFNLMCVCRSLTSYFYKGYFDNFLVFFEKYQQIERDLTDEPNILLYYDFMQKNGFDEDILNIYKMFKAALITEPSFILKGDPKEYEPWDDVFYTNQEYIKTMREQKE